jgi:hypothetical protein
MVVMYVWPNSMKSSSSRRSISMSRPRSSGITRSAFVRTPWISGGGI